MNNIFLFDNIENKIIEINEDEKKDVYDKLYFLQYRLPTSDELSKSDNTKVKKLLTTHKIDDILKIIRVKLSKIEEKIPLYDIYTENIYLIKKYNVYTRVIHQHYRFPEKHLLEEISEKRKVYQNSTDRLTLRKLKKIDLTLNFMNSFDLDVLFDTYVKIFYKYSSFVGKETTVCKNPSFLPQFTYIKPYLTRSEVINSALNFEIKLSKDYIEPEEVNKICKQISKYQLNSNVLLQHQHFITDSGSLGLVQYYTLQGSYFMNQYLRNFTSYMTKNEYLEELIEPMWKLVLDAPEFDKSYILYRFISRDDYLQHLKVGDEYIENGFMSTTRDPFYRADEYKFGFILIKVKIPANKKGVALCLETISHFPEEEEVIFPPNSKFRLVSKDEDCLYYHTDIHFASKVKTRYEFEWIENGSIKFDRKKEDVKTYDIDFLRLGKINAVTLTEKIKQFDNMYVNKFGQFNVALGDKTFTVMTEWFDSTSAYKSFYALEIKNGYAIYSIYKGYILFFIELGETNEGKQMHVNYYVKYSSIDPSKVIGNDNMIKFFSSIANYFDISNVILYANYINCGTKIIQSGGINISYNNLKQRGFATITDVENNKILNVLNKPVEQFNLIGGSYCTDLYQYLSTGIKKYSEDNILNVELQPKFSYHDLNYLKKLSPSQVLQKEDRDEIYQLYDKYYKELKKGDNVADFYLWLIEENKCYLLDTFIQKIDKILGKNNPFRNDMYVLDASTYLYNRKYITSYPINISILPTLKRNIVKENKFDTRLEEVSFGRR